MSRLFFIFVTFIGFFLYFGFCNVYSESWGESLFAVRRYDFGRIAIGAKAEYRFAMSNRFKQDIRVVSLNTSCGCTLSELSSDLIVSGGTEYLTATLNTNGQHTHEKKAIITIHFEVKVDGRVLYDSAQIAVSGYIRPDVVLLPSGSIEFGAVKRGDTVVRRIRLEHAGKEGWELTKVERNNPHIHVRAEAIPFSDGSFWKNGEIHYQITATLKPNTPAGYVKDVIKFSTNEKNESNKINEKQKDNLWNNETKRENGNEIIIPINGVVTEPLQVKPSPFVITLANEEKDVAKNIVIRSDRQFKILDVNCEDKRFKFSFSEHESSIQIIAAIFRTKNNTTPIQDNNLNIQIHTNLPEQKLINLETIQISQNNHTAN